MIPLVVNRYVVGGLAALALVGFVFWQGAKWSTERDLARAATATIENLNARGRIDAEVADASKDELCRRLDAARWNQETKECE